MSSYRTNGTNSSLQLASVVYATPPFSMMVDCIPYTAPSAGVLLSQLVNANNFDGHLIEYSTGSLFAATTSNSVFTFSGGIPIGPIGTRQVFGGVWKSSTSRQCFVNGNGDAVGTGSSTPLGTINNFTIWACKRNSFTVSNNAGAANIFSAFVWNVALDASDFLAIYKGVSPALIRRPNIVEGWIFSFKNNESGWKGPYISGPRGIIAGTTLTAVTIPADSIDEPNFNVNPLNLSRLKFIPSTPQIGSLVYAKAAVNRAANW